MVYKKIVQSILPRVYIKNMDIQRLLKTLKVALMDVYDRFPLQSFELLDGGTQVIKTSQSFGLLDGGT